MMLLLSATPSLLVPSRVSSIRMSGGATPDRRTILAGGAAGLFLPPEAVLAKSSSIISGSNPAAPGYTVGVFEHGTASYASWRKVLDGFIDPATKQVALPPDMETIRIIYAKVAKGEKAPEGVLAIQVLADSGLKGVQTFYNQDPKKGGPGGDGEPWKGGRAAGWLVDPWHANFYQPRLFRGLKDGPPPRLKKGMGVIYGGHSLGKGETFDTWAQGFTSADADAFHAACGIVSSVAGPALSGPSTDIKPKGPGVGVIHFTKSAADTQKFLDGFGPFWEGAVKAGKAANPLRLSVAEVTEDFIYPGDPSYIAPKKKA